MKLCTICSLNSEYVFFFVPTLDEVWLLIGQVINKVVSGGVPGQSEVSLQNEPISTRSLPIYNLLRTAFLAISTRSITCRCTSVQVGT